MDALRNLKPENVISYQRQSVAKGDGRSKSISDQSTENARTCQFYLGFDLLPENSLDEEKNHGGNEFWTGSGLEMLVGDEALRPTLGSIVERVKKSEIKAIICWSTCRLWRRVSVCEMLVDILAKHGCIIIDRNGILDCTTPDGRNRLFASATSSQHMREMAVVNSPRGVRRSREIGLAVASSHILGYRHLGRGRIKIVSEELELVRRIYRMYVGGMSKTQIARTLMAEGIEMPRELSDKRSIKRTEHTAGIFYNKNVTTILKDPRYQGLQPHEKQLWPCEAFLIDGQPAVDPALYKEAQRLLNSGKRTSNSACAKNYLAGLFRCGICGQYLTINPVKQTDGSIKKYWTSKRYDIQCWCTHPLPNITEAAMREYTEDVLMPLLISEASSILDIRAEQSTATKVALLESEIELAEANFESRLEALFGDTERGDPRTALRIIETKHLEKMEPMRMRLTELRRMEQQEAEHPVDAVEVLSHWEQLSDRQKRIAIHKVLRWVALVPSEDFIERSTRRGSRDHKREIAGAPPTGKIFFLTSWNSFHTAIVTRVPNKKSTTWHKIVGLVQAAPSECIGSAADLPSPCEFAAGLKRSYDGRGYKYRPEDVMPGFIHVPNPPVIKVGGAF